MVLLYQLSVFLLAFDFLIFISHHPGYLFYFGLKVKVEIFSGYRGTGHAHMVNHKKCKGFA